MNELKNSKNVLQKRHIDTDKAIHNIITVLYDDTTTQILPGNLELKLKEITKNAQRNCCWELLDRFEDTPMQEIPIINEYLNELSVED